MRGLVRILMAEWVRGSVVRLFFSNGRIAEVSLPIRSAKRARVVSAGLGLDLGDGFELSSTALVRRRGRVYQAGISCAT